MSERHVTEDRVRAEHLADVHAAHQWAYLVGVIIGGLALMLALIYALGASA